MDTRANDAREAGLAALERQHEDLAELFLQHQERLLAFDVDAAERALERYAAALRTHLEFEEAHLLPVYEDPARCPDVSKRATGEVFRLEHAKVLALLEDVRARVAGLRGPAIERGRPAPRDVLAVLEREATFKGLVHHHEQRETIYLFPALEAALSEDGLRELVRRAPRLPG